MTPLDNIYNRFMPKLPPPKDAEAQRARDELNQRVIQQLKDNPQGATYLGMPGVGNNREFTNPVAPIAKAYNNAGGGLAGVGGVLGAAGKTVANDASQLVGNLAQPFIDANQRVTDQIATTYNASKSVLPHASQAVSDFSSGVQSGYNNKPIQQPEIDLSFIPQGLGPRAQPGSANPNAPAPKIPLDPRGDMNEQIMRSQPDFKNNQSAANLMNDGFVRLDSLPGTTDPKTNGSYLGANDILVKERLGTPQEYTAAVQNNQDSTRFGQQAGLQQAQGAPGYAPNDATRAGMQNGGAITEYAIPGKGTATFYGERRGGGGLSVVSGRTPEEQAAINAQVASIDSQTAAMRGLRNANRLDQGGVTVEQEEQMNAMRQMMGQLAPPPDVGGLQEQQAALMQQLQDAQNIKGPGKRRQREDAMEAAKIGLAQNDSQMKMAQQAYGTQAGMAANLIGSQNDMASKSAANEFAALKYAAERGDKQAELKLNEFKSYMDWIDKGQGRSLEAQRNSILANRPASGSSEMPGVYKSMDENGREIFNTELFEQWNNIQPLGDGKSAKPGQIYKSSNGTYGRIDPETGQYVDGLSYQQIHNKR